MIYSYSVKHNGVFYRAGENVPDEDPVKATAKAEEPTLLTDIDATDKSSNAESEQKPAKRRYTKRK